MKIYLKLLELGPVQAGNIIQTTKLSRATAYDALDRLTKKGLVSKSTKHSVALYIPTDPKFLEFLLQNEQDRIAKNQEKLKRYMPELLSKQNARMRLPSVRIYEGFEGIQKVLDDTLVAKEIVYAYANIDPIETTVESIITAYRKKRAKTNMRVNGLIIKTPDAERILMNYDRKHVEYRWLPAGSNMFYLEMSIYDGKVSYITYRDTNPIAVVIEDADIYNLHRSTFETLWNLSSSEM